MDGLVEEWRKREERKTGVRMKAWMDAWMARCFSRWMDHLVWIDGCIDAVGD